MVCSMRFISSFRVGVGYRIRGLGLLMARCPSPMVASRATSRQPYAREMFYSTLAGCSAPRTWAMHAPATGVRVARIRNMQCMRATRPSNMPGGSKLEHAAACHASKSREKVAAWRTRAQHPACQYQLNTAGVSVAQDDAAPHRTLNAAACARSKPH